MPDVEKDDAEIKRRGRETLAKLQYCAHQMFGHLLVIVWDDHGQWRSVLYACRALSDPVWTLEKCNDCC